MRMTEVSFSNALPVQGYGHGFFRIADSVNYGPLLVGPTGRVPWAGLDDLDPLTALGGQIDVLFLGMGAEIAHPPDTLRTAMEAAGIGVEPMASPTACRSYNVLLSEGRRIALAALPV